MKINNNTAFITVLESIYDADDLKKLKMQFENQKHRAISN